MAQPTLAYRVSVRWPWLYAALYIVGLRDLAFRDCVKLHREPPC